MASKQSVLANHLASSWQMIKLC